MEQGEPRTNQDPLSGLMTRSVSLSFHAEKKHFVPPAYLMEMRCVATSPAVVGHSRSSTVRAHLTTPSLTVRNQKLEWATNEGRNILILFCGNKITYILIDFFGRMESLLGLFAIVGYPICRERYLFFYDGSW